MVFGCVRRGSNQIRSMAVWAGGALVLPADWKVRATGRLESPPYLQLTGLLPFPRVVLPSGPCVRPPQGHLLLPEGVSLCFVLLP